THEHWDHYGATADFVSMFGCRTLMSRPGVEVFKTHPKATMEDGSEHGYCSYKDFDIDIIIDDGDTLKLGNTELEFRLTPGHSEGVITIFFDVEEGGKKYKCALFGGATTVTCYKELCDQCGIPRSTRQEFLKSLERFKGRPVDIVLGNHPPQNHNNEKIARMLEDPSVNPFIDPAEWDRFLDETHAMVEKFLTETDPE
ncbi:MAG: MBL fold metallo-hydrolase, partial [Firmicutes bacterium]|nr:MBL fold metallo-hydrolase [Bacillota bacterium]